MPQRTLTFQSSFNRGEVDPLLHARRDLDAYYQGARTLRNLLPIPQGGVTNAPGWEYIATLPADQNYRFVRFKFSRTSRFMLLLSESEIRVYKAGVLQATVTGTPYTNAQIPEIKFWQSRDTLILTHEDVQYQTLVRGATDADWTLSALSVTHVPTFEFDPPTQGTLTVAARKGTNVLCSSTAGDFVSGDVGKYIAGAAGGYAQIVQYVSNTQVRVDIEQSFPIPEDGTSSDPPDPMGPGEWSIEEAVWSATRGWPHSVAISNGRLWFGGSASLPARLWGSTTFQFFDFNRGKGRDDQAIEVDADSDALAFIEDVFPGRHLQIFTDEGEFYVPEEPITPENARLKPATKRGSKEGVGVVGIDGLTLYVQAGGKALRQYLFDFAEDSYRSTPISVLSSHLFAKPTDMAYRQATSTDETDLILIVNDPDGTSSLAGSLIVLSLLQDQDVAAFSLRTTDGKIRNVGVDGEDVYVVVARQKDAGSPVVATLERWNPAHRLDFSKRITTGLPAQTFTGLDHLNGYTVTVLADDSVLTPVTVSGGQATIERAATTYVEFGLWPSDTPRVSFLPLEPLAGQGSSLGRKKKISKATLWLKDTTGLAVNGDRQPWLEFVHDKFGVPPQPRSGVLVVEDVPGEYDYDPQFEISLPDPVQFTLLGVELEAGVT